MRTDSIPCSVHAVDVLIGHYYDVRIGDRIVSVRIESRIDSGIWEASIAERRLVTVVLRDLLGPSAEAAPAISAPSPSPEVIRDSKRLAAGDLD